MRPPEQAFQDVLLAERIAERYASRHSDGSLHCDMEKDCKEPITHIDKKGYIYCTKHGERRKSSGTPCRKLKPTELQKLEKDGTVARY